MVTQKQKVSKKNRIQPKEMDELIKKILETHFWPTELKVNEVYTCQHDDTDGSHEGCLSVLVDFCGDVRLKLDNHPMLRFRIHGGGGNSLRTRNALLILAIAMKLDALSK